VEKDWVMPGVVRVGKDVHVGHASGTPNPFHKTSYATGSSNVIANGGSGAEATATIPVTIYQYERVDTTDPVQPYNTPSSSLARSINFGIQLSSGSVMDSTGTSLTKSNLSPHTPDQINTKLSGI
jgi:hypothetical protein